jgi:hypothetical protein
MSTTDTVGPIEGVENAIDGAFTPLSEAVSAVIFYQVPVGGGAMFPWIVAWLIIGAVVFTIGYRFIQIRGFGHAVALARGGYDHPDDPGRSRTSRPSPRPCPGRSASATSPASRSRSPWAGRGPRSG